MHSLYISKSSQPNCLTRALTAKIRSDTNGTLLPNSVSTAEDNIDLIEIRVRFTCAQNVNATQMYRRDFRSMQIGGYWNQVLPELKRALREKYFGNFTYSHNLMPEWRHIVYMLLEQNSDNSTKQKTDHMMRQAEQKLSYITQWSPWYSSVSQKVSEDYSTRSTNEPFWRHDGKKKNQTSTSLRFWLSDMENASIGGDLVFWYSPERAILSMTSQRIKRLHSNTIHFSLPEAGLCMGMGSASEDLMNTVYLPWKGLLHRYLQRDWKVFLSVIGAMTLENHLGFDTPVLNSVIEAVDGKGYLFSRQTGVMYALSQAKEVAWFEGDFEALMLLKFGAFATALFLLFSMSSLVSFLLSQTQQRMLRFTLELQSHLRRRLPLSPLILSHALESLVYIPIILGVLFFLFEFFSDQLLAFLILSATWVAEFFNVACCRTKNSILLFPQVFCFSFMTFFCYYLTHPFGFHYLALYACFSATVLAMFYVWDKYELPALIEARVTPANPREPEVVEIMQQWPSSVGPRPAAVISLNVSVVRDAQPRMSNEPLRRRRAGTAPQSSASIASADFPEDHASSAASTATSQASVSMSDTTAQYQNSTSTAHRGRSCSHPNLTVPSTTTRDSEQRERSFAVSAFEDNPRLISSYFNSILPASEQRISRRASLAERLSLRQPRWRLAENRDIDQPDLVLDRTREICSAADDVIQSMQSAEPEHGINTADGESEREGDDQESGDGVEDRNLDSDRHLNSSSDTSVSDSVLQNLPTDYSQTRNRNLQRIHGGPEVNASNIASHDGSNEDSLASSTSSIGSPPSSPFLNNQIVMLRGVANSWMQHMAHLMRTTIEEEQHDMHPEQPASAHDATTRAPRRHPGSFDASDRAFR